MSALREVLPGESHLQSECEALRERVRTLQLEVRRLTIERDQQRQLNEMLFDRLKGHSERLKQVMR